MNQIKRILIDCDGVLTDGTLTIDHKGEKLFKRFHTRDVRAIRELIFNGYEVVIVTADDWPGIHHFASKVGAEVCILRDKCAVPYVDFIAVGDDAWDIPMLRRAARAFAPRTADASIWTALKNVHQLSCEGGQGCIAALARILLSES